MQSNGGARPKDKVYNQRSNDDALDSGMPDDLKDDSFYDVLIVCTKEDENEASKLAENMRDTIKLPSNRQVEIGLCFIDKNLHSLDEKNIKRKICRSTHVVGYVTESFMQKDNWYKICPFVQDKMNNEQFIPAMTKNPEDFRKILRKFPFGLDPRTVSSLNLYTDDGESLKSFRNDVESTYKIFESSKLNHMQSKENWRKEAAFIGTKDEGEQSSSPTVTVNANIVSIGNGCIFLRENIIKTDFHENGGIISSPSSTTEQKVQNPEMNKTEYNTYPNTKTDYSFRSDRGSESTLSRTLPESNINRGPIILDEIPRIPTDDLQLSDNRHDTKVKEIQ